MEAALLMSLILPLLISIMIMGFYVHDNARMQCIAVEITAKGSNMCEYDDRDAVLQKTLRDRTGQAAMWSKNVTGSVSAGEKNVSCCVNGNFRFPPVMSVFRKEGAASQEKSWNRKIYRPASLIRKVRGVKGLADTLMKKGDS